MNLKFGLPPRCEMLSTEPVTKLSRPMTLWPRDNSRSVKCEPRNPAAPVTTDAGFSFFIKAGWLNHKSPNSQIVLKADADSMIKREKHRISPFQIRCRKAM